MTGVEKVVYGLLLLGRICAGAVMIYSGVELVRGEGLLSNSAFGDAMTGVFVIGLGAFCLYQGVIVWILDTFFPDDRRKE